MREKVKQTIVLEFRAKKCLLLTDLLPPIAIIECNTIGRNFTSLKDAKSHSLNHNKQKSQNWFLTIYNFSAFVVTFAMFIF